MVPGGSHGLLEAVRWSGRLWVLLSVCISTAVSLFSLWKRHVLIVVLDFWYSPIIAYTGFIVGSTFPFFTSGFTNPTTSGSVSPDASVISDGKLTRLFEVPTPFSSHAFHPVDGYLQSVPYHFFIYLFPLHRTLYLVLFVLVNFWSIFVSSMHLFLIATSYSAKSRFMTRTWLLDTFWKRLSMGLPTTPCIIYISLSTTARYDLITLKASANFDCSIRPVLHMGRPLWKFLSSAGISTRSSVRGARGKAGVVQTLMNVLYIYATRRALRRVATRLRIGTSCLSLLAN